MPEPKFHAPLMRYPPSTRSPRPLGANCPPMVTRSADPNVSRKPSSGRYAATAAADGRLAIPIHPNEPSSSAIRSQVSIISTKVGSTPPAAAGLNRRMRPVSHICSTTGSVRVRFTSEASASAVTTAAIRSTSSTPAGLGATSLSRVRPHPSILAHGRAVDEHGGLSAPAPPARRAGWAGRPAPAPRRRGPGWHRRGGR